MRAARAWQGGGANADVTVTSRTAVSALKNARFGF